MTRVDAVVVEVDLVAFGRDVRVVGTHAGEHLPLHLVQAGDQQRIADASQHKGAEGHRPRALKLECVGHGLKAASRDADPSAGQLGESAAAQVQQHPRPLEQVGMVLFVKGMRGHAYAGAAARAGRGIDGKAVVLQNAQHAVLRGARLTAQRAAFQNLAHMIGKPRVMAALDAHGRKGRRIIGAPAEDDLRLLQRVQNWLHPHLRHHARGLRQRLWGQVGHIGTHLLNAALRHRLQNGFVWNVRPDHCGFGMPVPPPRTARG